MGCSTVVSNATKGAPTGRLPRVAARAASFSAQGGAVTATRTYATARGPAYVPAQTSSSVLLSTSATSPARATQPPASAPTRTPPTAPPATTATPARKPTPVRTARASGRTRSSAPPSTSATTQ